MSTEAPSPDIELKETRRSTLVLAWQNTLLRLKGRRSDVALARLADDPEDVIAEFQGRHFYFKDVGDEEERAELDSLSRNALRGVLLGENSLINYRLGKLQEEVSHLEHRAQVIGRAVQYLTQEEE